MTSLLSILVVILGILASNAITQPKCSQDHPGQQHRTESVLKKGDNRMTLSVAGHVTIFAQQRFNLKGLISDSDVYRVFHMKNGKGGGEMYTFLKWKLGSPTAVAGQFVTAGYQHFDKAYSDEAAAMLLGILDFSKKDPEILIPEWMQDGLEELVQKGAAASIEAGLGLLGVPPEASGPLAEKVADMLAKKVSKQARKTVGVFMPKSFDVDNRLVEGAIKAKQGSLTKKQTLSKSVKR